jgi:trehalose 6-phosphate phosphatase
MGLTGTLPPLSDDWALFLDVDGTLLDIAPCPDAVTVPQGLRETLSELHRRLDGALALISGRAITDIDRIFAPLKLPAAGQHGAERRARPEGAIIPAAGGADFGALLARLKPFAAAHPGVLIEPKGFSVAVHCRNAPDALHEAGALVAQAAAESGGALEVLPAHGGFDVKLKGASKRHAVESFMAETPFKGRIPVFAGDDATDEDALVAVRARGGHAICVGGAAASQATLRAAGPAELRRWLGVRVPAEESAR